ncbi:hypothetical protein [Caballeronia sp. LZ001]|uniref:hypothetical protein n=1 Tax=Caballeronia sp. LZ001 TaxID=3038553 RepID=UPI00285E6C00|nr:hypothetical protein [Caballeronia sp. LZ001]MDR5806473.1 hypothetical protein [Caballeronia sp. LZ001]
MLTTVAREVVQRNSVQLIGGSFNTGERATRIGLIRTPATRYRSTTAKNMKFTAGNAHKDAVTSSKGKISKRHPGTSQKSGLSSRSNLPPSQSSSARYRFL